MYIQVTVLKEGAENLSSFKNMLYMGDIGKVHLVASCFSLKE